jgi:hypothetical protein
MGFSYYGLILIYPIVVAFLTTFMFNTELWESIKRAYYLLAGYTITYAAIMLIILSTVKFINFALNFVIFSIGYFAIVFIRLYIQTEEYDIFEKLQPEKSQ